MTIACRATACGLAAAIGQASAVVGWVKRCFRYGLALSKTSFRHPLPKRKRPRGRDRNRIAEFRRRIPGGLLASGYAVEEAISGAVPDHAARKRPFRVIEDAVVAQEQGRGRCELQQLRRAPCRGGTASARNGERGPARAQ